MKFTAVALALAGAAYAQNMSLIQALSSQPNLSGLVGLLNGSAGVQVNTQQLASMTNVTFLAPDNDAITAFTNSTAGGQLLSNSALLEAVLSYHVIQGNHSNITNTTFFATGLQQGQYANVTGGQRVEALVGGSGSNVTFFSGLLQNSTVVNSSIPFSGGTIHVINRLLTLPQNVTSTGVALNLTSAVGAIDTLGLNQTIDSMADLTLFLPNNAAFSAIGGNLANLSMSNLTQILEYHVINGSVLYSTNITNGSMATTMEGGNVTIREEDGGVYVNNAKVLIPNVLVSNGVIHVIDRVLNPANSTIEPNTSTTEQAFPGATSASEEPFTSGVPTPTSAVETNAVTSAVASASSSSSGGAWRPIETGALGMAALFGGAAAVLNM